LFVNTNINNYSFGYNTKNNKHELKNSNSEKEDCTTQIDSCENDSIVVSPLSSLDDNVDKNTLSFFSGKRQCTRCDMVLPKESFTTSQLKGSIQKIKCKSCISKGKVTKKSSSNKKRNTKLLNKDFKIVIKTSSRKITTSGSYQNSNNTEETIKICSSINNKKNAKKKNNAAKKKSQNKNLITNKDEVKALLRERINIMPDQQQQPQSIHLDWNSLPSSSISDADEKNVSRQVLQRGDYGPVDEKIKARILTILKSSSMTLSQVISLRAALLQQKAMFHHNRLVSKGLALYQDYTTKRKSITSLSRDVDCPPLNVFRTVVFKHMCNFKKAQIKKCLNNPGAYLQKREQEELRIALKTDVTAQFDQAQLLRAADRFEDIIAAFLTEKGVTFVRQEQLMEEQKKAFGNAVVTPDFLILDEFYINDQRINWIDAKAFYGANTEQIVKTFRRQMSKYIDYWGEGAVIFLEGCNEVLKLDKCTTLSAQGVLKGIDNFWDDVFTLS